VWQLSPRADFPLKREGFLLEVNETEAETGHQIPAQTLLLAGVDTAAVVLALFAAIGLRFGADTPVMWVTSRGAWVTAMVTCSSYAM